MIISSEAVSDPVGSRMNSSSRLLTGGARGVGPLDAKGPSAFGNLRPGHALTSNDLSVLLDWLAAQGVLHIATRDVSMIASRRNPMQEGVWLNTLYSTEGETTRDAAPVN